MIKPNLYLVGGQKCGSSSLAYYLSQHPNCLMSTPKEPSFFSRRENLEDIENYGKYFLDYSNQEIIFDASTGYFMEEYCAERIFKFSSDAKIIILLRRPVDRAISAYMHMKKRFHDSRSITSAFFNIPSVLQETLVEEERRINIALENGQIKTKRYVERYDDYMWQFRYIKNSVYIDNVRRFQNTFGRDNVYILTLEELTNDVESTMSSIYDFLEIPYFSNNSIGEHINPTYLPPQIDIFKETNWHPLNSIYEKFSKTILPKIGKLRGEVSINGIDTNLLHIKKELDSVLSTQYAELSELTNKDLSNIWESYE